MADLPELLPSVVTEMDKLRDLTMDERKYEQHQKKQAGFNKQRKGRINNWVKENLLIRISRKMFDIFVIQTPPCAFNTLLT